MAYGSFKVLAGDFVTGKDNQFLAGYFKMRTPGKIFREKIPVSEVAELEMASEEAVKRLGGTVGWGIAGAALLGPVGLLAGLIAGGKGKDVTFVCKLKDGRKFLAVAPSKVYAQMSAALF